MDDLLEIIAFLVTFVIFIVSAIIKQKNKNTTPSESNNGFMETFFDMDEATEEAYSKGEILEESLKRKQKMADEKSSQLQAQEGVDAIPDGEDEFYEGQEQLASIKDDFDLRKAVIYSEILNRKTF